MVLSGLDYFWYLALFLITTSPYYRFLGYFHPHPPPSKSPLSTLIHIANRALCRLSYLRVANGAAHTSLAQKSVLMIIRWEERASKGRGQTGSFHQWKFRVTDFCIPALR